MCGKVGTWSWDFGGRSPGWSCKDQDPGTEIGCPGAGWEARGHGGVRKFTTQDLEWGVLKPEESAGLRIVGEVNLVLGTWRAGEKPQLILGCGVVFLGPERLG